MDFILALKPSQVIAINQQESKSKKIALKNPTKKLKYMRLPNFRKYPSGKERKEIFFKYFFYLVESRNQQILKIRKKVVLWKRNLKNININQTKTVQGLAKKYKVKDFDIQKHSSWNRLLARLDIIPASLALAQGAKESLWGTSRFARYGYNYYGQRCFSRGCGIVPKARGNRRFEVTTFSSPRTGVNSYIHNLNTHFAYDSLRKIRSRQRAKGKKITGLALANALGKYSERGSAYIKDLKSLIRYNKLSQYDTH
jgi:Bax protein